MLLIKKGYKNLEEKIWVHSLIRLGIIKQARVGFINLMYPYVGVRIEHIFMSRDIFLKCLSEFLLVSKYDNN